MRLAVSFWLSVVCAPALACGKVEARLDGDGGGSAVDSGPGGERDGGDSDAGDGPPDAGQNACSWQPISTDDLVAVNSPGTEGSASLTGDGLALFFTVLESAGSLDIYDATREADGDPFSAPRLLGELSLPEQDEYDVEISTSGEEIFFLRTDSDDILTAARASAGAAFGEVTPTGLLGYSPSLSGDGLRLYFLDLDLIKIQRSSRESIDAPWDTPVDVGPVKDAAWIDVSSDELSVLVSGGKPPVGLARRGSVEDPFDGPVPAGDVFLKEEPPIVFLDEASWNGRQDQIVLSALLEDGTADLFLSSCE